MKQLKAHKIFTIPGNIIKQLKVGAIRIWDVRTPMEYIHGHIEGAENVPFDELEWYLENAMECDKTIVTCSTGDRRSAKACEILQGEGVEVVDGGDWEKLKELIAEENS